MPPTYVFEAMRKIVNGGAANFPALLFAVALACAYILGAVAVFAYTHRLCIRTGLIARYSAESVS
jgi:ABC-2 type transport system permease protein